MCWWINEWMKKKRSIRAAVRNKTIQNAWHAFEYRLNENRTFLYLSLLFRTQHSFLAHNLQFVRRIKTHSTERIGIPWMNKNSTWCIYIYNRIVRIPSNCFKLSSNFFSSSESFLILFFVFLLFVRIIIVLCRGECTCMCVCLFAPAVLQHWPVPHFIHIYIYT